MHKHGDDLVVHLRSTLQLAALAAAALPAIINAATNRAGAAK